MAFEIGVIFQSIKSGFNAGIFLGKFFGIIESVENKVEKLINNKYNSAIDYLNQAQKSSILEEQKTLFREARRAFTEAKDFVQYDKLVISYLGLAICHYYLTDYENCRSTLKELSELKLVLPSLVQSTKSVLSYGYEKLQPYAPANIITQIKDAFKLNTYLKSMPKEPSLSQQIEMTKISLKYQKSSLGTVSSVEYLERFLKILEIQEEAGSLSKIL
ncbi:hypothetical protein H6G04_33705 [Calothrix membranacea FACHB-236]|nr:hypothetical protein [Calothrix membranacea FACHB-236]